MEKSTRRLGRQLKRIRVTAHLSQYSVSIGTGIDRSRLSSIENGYICPRTDEVEQIERFVSEAQCQQMARLKRVLSITQLGKNRDSRK
jgi:predicted transcriptional regulator